MLKMSKSFPSLLLLPPSPATVNLASFSATYRPSIIAAVSALKDLPTSTELLVLLSCSSIHGRLNQPRSQIYSEVQHLVGGLYSLICVACAKLGVDVDSDSPGAIDARVLLLDYDSIQEFSSVNITPLGSLVAGPIIDLPTFAATRRSWNIIFSVDGEDGQRLMTSYLDLAGKTSPPLRGQIRIVNGGVAIQKDGGYLRTLPTLATFHTVVAVGGTFDHLHAGHKLLLTATALLLQPARFTATAPRRLIVGVTGDELLRNKKYAQYLKSWKQRQEDVVNFLLSILSFTSFGYEDAIQTLSINEPVPNGKAIHTKLKGSLITIECVEIQDPFGPTITDESITALVVSGETREGGKAVNDSRLEKGWKALEVFEVDVLEAQDDEGAATKSDDFSSKISSTAIRKRKAEGTLASSL